MSLIFFHYLSHTAWQLCDKELRHEKGIGQALGNSTSYRDLDSYSMDDLEGHISGEQYQFITQPLKKSLCDRRK